MMTTTSPAWRLPVRRQRDQFHAQHRFVVVARHSGLAVEGHYFEDRAQRARQVLAEHNARYGHPADFVVLPIPPELCGKAPEHWERALAN